MEGYMHLYHPQTVLWKTIIDAGEIGELQQVKSCFSFQLNRDSENYRWNKSSGGGAMWDVGVYPLSLFQYILNKSPVSGEAFRHLIDGMDHADTVSLAYADGLTGQFFVSFRSDYNTETVFLGHKGQLTISHPFNAVEQCNAYLRKGNKTESLDLPTQYLYRGEVEAMHDYILHGKTPHADLQFSRSVLETILMLKAND
jgi:predicted dehydrogenase